MSNGGFIESEGSLIRIMDLQGLEGLAEGEIRL
jgi:hypothetical protein